MNGNLLHADQRRVLGRANRLPNKLHNGRALDLRHLFGRDTLRIIRPNRPDCQQPRQRFDRRRAESGLPVATNLCFTRPKRHISNLVVHCLTANSSMVVKNLGAGTIDE